ncbi:WS/DGAT domain-containing protein, partial [Rhodococcus sp. NPDC059234]|uniref:WS/DGAT domain-containing protein n=1 Tax=Rhodococcus sp. NPDC059234 TaxID=3346781 RepID=UPI00366E34E8
PWRPAVALAAAAARLPVQVVETIRRAGPAHRTHRQLERDTEAGLVPAKPPSLPKLSTNARPNEYRTIRTVVLDAADLRGAGTSVTVGAMTAISMALTRYLGLHGIAVDEGLAAEVTVAKSGPALARNHFRNLAVDLFPDVEDPRERAESIAQSLRTRRLRGDHPARAAEDRAMAAIPAALARRGVEQFDFTAVPDTVTGHTVVSSVARGPADLTLGGARVRFTAGFPALSQFMGLTHGVHGIGETVTLSIVTSPSVMTDVDTYEDLLRAAVAEVRDAAAVGQPVE